MNLKLFFYLIFIIFLNTNLFAYHFGINADNFDNQLDNPGFVKAIKKLNPYFIVWHIQPKDEVFYDSLKKIIDFSRKNKIYYLFNTENVNYLPDLKLFMHKDGTKRWDLSETTLKMLRDDNFFMGIVYDEALLMQSLNHHFADGITIKPYFCDTKKMDVKEAFECVSKKISELKKYYAKYNKIMVFEMVFPAYAHVVAKSGGIPAPKILKENFCDLMYYFYSSAAIEYNLSQLWANIDLWFGDNFPMYGKRKKGEYYHTPEELFEALKYTYKMSFDYVYIEHAKALIDENFNLTEYGKKVIEFQKIKKNLKKKKSWREIKPDYVVKFFPYGYWGQKYSDTIPDHPYGSFRFNNKLKKSNLKLLKLLNKLSKGKIPPAANNWNAVLYPYFQQTKYFMFANLPPILFFDHNVKKLPKANKKKYDFLKNN